MSIANYSSRQTIFEKIWQTHSVHSSPGSPTILYIDLQLVHEVTSPQAFAALRDKGLPVRKPGQTMATMDHSIPTRAVKPEEMDPLAQAQLRKMEENCAYFGVPLLHADHPGRGIVHVIGPELGLTQPGMTIVCGDSHTSTHGAFGALAFGIGTSEVEHVLATQTLLQHKPRTMEIAFDGRLQRGVGAKDIILALIAQIGTDGGTGCVFEYRGEAIRGLSMEQRMTICNMSIEAGARAGIISPDETTYSYIAGKPAAPQGAAWEQALAYWRTLPTDDGAEFDSRVTLDVSALEPMITFGTNPGMAIHITQNIPLPEEIKDAAQRQALQKALDYVALKPGQPLLGQKIDAVFIGSCTNGRISDLREAASIMAGRKVNKHVRVLVVPGSRQVKAQAEAEGLDKVFTAAGAEWRDAGCSMCLAMNGDQLAPGEYAVSTSNRNFEGRQGKGSRTFLASPLTAAASALSGCVADPRPFLPAI